MCALYVHHYRCDFVAFVFTYIIKCVIFSLVFMLKRVCMPLVYLFFLVNFLISVNLNTYFLFWGLMKTPLLSSAGFVCLRVGYREVFWEEFSKLT